MQLKLFKHVKDSLIIFVNLESNQNKEKLSRNDVAKIHEFKKRL